MVNLSRRGLLGMLAVGLGAAIVRPGLIMPIKPALVPQPTFQSLTQPVLHPGRMLFEDATGFRLLVDTTQADLMEAMTDVMFQGFGTSLRDGRFIADADASYRLDKEFEARRLTAWVMDGQPGIRRRFRGIPVENWPIHSHDSRTTVVRRVHDRALAGDVRAIEFLLKARA